MNVLLVDDNEDIRRIARLALEKLGGWDVSDVSSGQAALDLTLRQQFDVVLLDVMMPGLDGLATIDLLRERGDTTPVVLLTALVRHSDRVLHEESDAIGTIAKPFDPLTLTADVQRLLSESTG